MDIYKFTFKGPIQKIISRVLSFLYNILTGMSIDFLLLFPLSEIHYFSRA